MLPRIQNLVMKSVKFLDDKYIASFIKVFLVLYAGLVAPQLPRVFVYLFKNAIFKLFILFLIVFLGLKDPIISLLVAIGFTISMITLNKLETVGSVGDLLDTIIDSPQEIANDLVDGIQDLAKDVGGFVQDVSGPLKPVVAGAEDIVHGVIDMGQDVANTLVDTVQDAVGMFTRGNPEPAEEDEVQIKEKVGGYADEAIGASLE